MDSVGYGNPRVRFALDVGALAAAYALAGKLSLALALPPGYATAVWPPSGIALVALWRWGPRLWFGIGLGAAILNFAVAGSAPLAMIIALGNTLEALVALLLVRFILPGRDAPFDGLASPALLALIAVASAPIAASIACAGMVTTGAVGADGWASSWLTWWLGDATGILITGPLLLSWMGPTRLAWTRQRAAECGAMALAAGFVVALSAEWATRGVGLEARFLVLPVVVWAAVRFSEREVSTLCVLFGGASLIFVPRLPAAAVTPLNEILLLQAFIATIVLTGLTLTLAVQRQRRTGEILAHAQTELELYMAHASRDLQQPLQDVLRSSAELLRRQGDAARQDARESIAVLQHSALQLRELAHDLLHVSRATRGLLMTEEVDCESSLNRALASLDEEIASTGAHVERSALPFVRADPRLLERVFRNLIAAAIRHRGAAAPRISVKAHPTPEGWVFAVTDNGLDVADRYRNGVSDMFARLRHNLGEAAETGTGLALCRRIIEGHGGRLWIESLPDSGTAIHFSLPTAAQATPA